MIRFLRILSWRAAVPASAFACGTLLGWVVTPLLFVLVPLGALLGYALRAAAAAWGAFRVGERAAPDRSRGSPRAILASSLVFLILGGLPAAGLVAALTSIGPNPPGLADVLLG
jgi:hypothetical protein